MKRRAVALLIGLLLSACGGSDGATSSTAAVTTTSQQVDRERVDQAIDAAIEAGNLLGDLSDSDLSPREMIQIFKSAAGAYEQAATQLWPDIPAGMPSSVARKSSTRFSTTAGMLADYQECLQEIVDTGALLVCDLYGAELSKAGQKTGTAVVELVPYGSRSGDEVRALVAD
jgi:hypothetical protein